VHSPFPHPSLHATLSNTMRRLLLVTVPARRAAVLPAARAGLPTALARGASAAAAAAARCVPTASAALPSLRPPPLRQAQPSCAGASALASAVRQQRRLFAAFQNPRDLHRHRKRLDSFGKDAAKGDTKTLAACRDLLFDDDWFARKTAIDTIGKVANRGDETQLSVLYKHLEDTDIFVREAAVDAVAEVAQTADNVAISKLAMRLADEDCFVRTRAVVALGRLGEPGDVETMGLLDEMFDAGFVPVRKRVIEASLRLAPPPSGEANASLLARLRRGLDDSDSGVRIEARDALRKLGAAPAIA